METSDYLSITALLVSLLTMWLTLFRRGTIHMTKPTQIYLGVDGGDTKKNKVYFLTLLYSTGERGRIIEDLYVHLIQGESRQNFNIWAYHNSDVNMLVRGSGLFVGKTGIATNHHFLQPKDNPTYEFRAGEYTLEVYVRLVGKKQSRLLHRTTLSISDFQAVELAKGDRGIFFDWGPGSSQYHSHVDTKKPRGRNNGVDMLLQEMLK